MWNLKCDTLLLIVIAHDPLYFCSVSKLIYETETDSQT